MEPIGRRLHLIELEDQPWFPAALRDGLTDFLSFVAQLSRPAYRPFIDRLAAAMNRTGDDRIIDLCAGAAGPGTAMADLLQRALGRPVRVTLTDLYPNLPRFEQAARDSGGLVDYVAEPVDATNVAAELRGFRLVTNAFHHLPPELAEKLLADAVRQRQGVAVFEQLERTPTGLLAAASTVPLMLATTPLIKPRSLRRFAFTYLVPALPLCTLFDGTVSALRIYSPEELLELTRRADPDGAFAWEIGRLHAPMSPMRTTYLIGIPEASHSS